MREISTPKVNLDSGAAISALLRKGVFGDRVKKHDLKYANAIGGAAHDAGCGQLHNDEDAKFS